MAPLTAIVQEMEDVKRKDLKAPPHHLQTVIDGCNIVAWVFTPGEDFLVNHCDEILDQVSFYGNKVMQTGKDPDFKWYKAYSDLVKGISDFLKERKEFICEWTGKEDGADAFYNSVV